MVSTRPKRSTLGALIRRSRAGETVGGPALLPPSPAREKVARRKRSNACEASRPGGREWWHRCPSPPPPRSSGARVAVSGMGWGIVLCGVWVCVGMPHRHVCDRRAHPYVHTHTHTRGGGTGIYMSPARPLPPPPPQPLPPPPPLRPAPLLQHGLHLRLLREGSHVCRDHPWLAPSASAF